jgi:uncharacterized protein
MSIELEVKVVTRSSQSKVELREDGSLKAWIHAAPVEGQANRALCELLADKLRISLQSVTIVRGDSTRRKRIRLDGIERSELEKRLS